MKKVIELLKAEAQHDAETGSTPVSDGDHVRRGRYRRQDIADGGRNERVDGGRVVVGVAGAGSPIGHHQRLQIAVHQQKLQEQSRLRPRFAARRYHVILLPHHFYNNY